MLAAQDYQEMNEQFQVAIFKTYNPTMVVMNTSDLRYHIIGTAEQPPRALEVSQARCFYRRLFRAYKNNGETAMDILADSLGDATRVHGSSWMVAFSKAPYGFNYTVAKGP